MMLGGRAEENVPRLEKSLVEMEVLTLEVCKPLTQMGFTHKAVY